MPSPLILVVDDEETTRKSTGMALRHLGYRVETAENAEAALAMFDPARHALVLTDNRMNGKPGTVLAEQIRRLCPAIPIVLYTGFAPPTCAAISRVLEKPVELSLLDSTLRDLLRREGPSSQPAESQPSS